jgi:L-iditol 2-dehydrogenase
MKCIKVKNIGSFEILEEKIPEPGEGEVLIKVKVTGLCRTDLKIIQVGHRDLVLPRIPGEEVVGEVVEKGDGVERIKIGHRVYVYPGIWCGICPSCLSGAENLCREMRIMGFHRDGGFAQYVKVSAKSVIRLPDNIAFEDAVFAEPLSCCLNALELGGVKEDCKVAIWGAGPAGTLLEKAARAMGAHTTSIEPHEWRRELINGYASCPDDTFDTCLVAVGDKKSYEEAITKLAPRGRLVVFSGLSPHDCILPVDFNQLHYMEQTIVGAYGCCFRHGIEALDFIARGQISVRDMVSHRMSLWELEKGLDVVANRSGMKVHLYP